MADWQEIEQLQADFQRAQQSATMQRLSERNCIEILMKLEEMRMINVLHSSDGKEYLTPEKLQQEVEDELHVHGGRVNLVELQRLLNIDFSHIEAKSTQLVKSRNDIQIINGQLLTNSYLDQIADEINDNLQAHGHIKISELSKTYDLPGDFLIPELTRRIGDIIKGKMDAHGRETIYTDAYLARHKARIRGILTAVTRPIPVNLLHSREAVSLQITLMIVEKLIGEERIRGEISGGHSDKAVFYPYVYTETQNKWVESFFKQNNYLEYDAVSRLGISDPKSHLKKKFGEESPVMFLSTVCVGRSLVDRVMGVVDDAVAANDWNDVMSVLPSSFTPQDGGELLQRVLQERRKQKSVVGDGFVIGETIITSQQFIDSCLNYFDELIKEKADQEVKKTSILLLTDADKKEFAIQTGGDTNKKMDKKDERRRKALEGSGSVRRTGESGGSGSGAREVKTKGKDKKRMKWKKKEEKVVEKEDQDAIGVEEVEELLHDRLCECPDDMLQDVASMIVRPLNEKYRAAVKSVFLLGKQSDDNASPKSASENRKSRKQLEEELNLMWSNARLFAEAFKLFESDVSLMLQKYLLQTVCTQLTNILFVIAAMEFIHGVEVDQHLTDEIRMKLLSRIPPNVKPAMLRLHNSLNAKSFDEFSTALRDAASTSVCDVFIRNADKKKDRQIQHGHKMSLHQQLKEETDPALCLHLACSIIFQTCCGSMINFSGKLLPHILNKLQTYLDREVFTELMRYQELIMMKMNGSDVDLMEGLEKIKEFATSVKKKTSTSA